MTTSQVTQCHWSDLPACRNSAPNAEYGLWRLPPCGTAGCIHIGRFWACCRELREVPAIAMVADDGEGVELYGVTIPRRTFDVTSHRHCVFAECLDILVPEGRGSDAGEAVRGRRSGVPAPPPASCAASSGQLGVRTDQGSDVRGVEEHWHRQGTGEHAGEFVHGLLVAGDRGQQLPHLRRRGHGQVG